ncbi:MAG: hypothetical protein HY714_00095 [Candidatus Omnitrophica bacterium]|nr:hypothetical protein [Candidatus Omnitrophota bacterium]
MDDREEKKIEALLGGVRLKRPPEKLMENYVSEVRRKIDVPPAGPAFGLATAFLIAVAAVGLALWLHQAPVTQPRQVAPEVPAADRLSGGETGDSKASFEEIADEWLILQMLGEDQGVLDAYDPLEGDLEFLAQA